MDDTNINILDTNLKESIKTFFKMQKGRTIDILLLDNSYNKDAKKKGIADITNQTVYNDINEDGADKIHLVIALTDKTDDEVIQHFNLMKPADEIEIIQTPDKGIQINIKSTEENEPEIGDEFSDEIGGEELPGGDGGEEFGGEPEDEPVEEPEHNSDDEESDDEEDGSLDEYGEENENKPQIYKIEISDGGDEEHGVGDNTTSMKKSEKHMKDVPVKEDVKHVNSKSHLKHANPQSNLKTEELQESLVKTRKKIQSLMAENKQKTNELSEMTNLVKTFKKQEAEYKSAIKNLKGTLQEAALFTSNLSYIVKLLSENTTMKYISYLTWRLTTILIYYFTILFIR